MVVPAKEKISGEKVLKIYDPAMCCSSGVCGPNVDPALARFAGDGPCCGEEGCC